MLLDDHVDAPAFNWFSQSQFPMYFNITRRDSSSTMIKENESKNLIVFPTPVNDNITITSAEKIKTIELYSEYGTLLLSKNFKLEEAEYYYRINLEMQDNGFYYLTVLNFNNQCHRKKIIKIH